MSNTIDLDLTTVESSELDQLAQKIESFYKQDNFQKASLSYNWERTHLFLDGQQWLTYRGSRDTGGQWDRLEVSSANQYIPRPVTNYIFDAYQTLKGYLLKNEPRITVRPNTQTNKDKTAAKIAELVSESNWERLHEEENYEYAASCLETYGTVFKKDFWDNSYLSLAKVPRMVQQPAIDPNTGAPTGQMEEVQATDPETGEELFDELPLGDVQTAVVEPYRIALDPLANNLHDARWIMEYSIRPLNWIIENYDKPVEQDPNIEPELDEDGMPVIQQEHGYTGRAKEVKPEKALSNTLKRFYNLKTSSGVKNVQALSSAYSGSGPDGQMIEEAAVVKEYYERPTYKHPKGRLIVVANGVPLFADDSPCSGPEQGDWHPYSECRWEILPGRFWGKGPLDEACEINKHINSIDSVIILTRKTMAVPQKLEPRGSIAKGNNWTGEPGQRVTYTPGPNGEKPETIQPSGVHESVFQERAQKVEDIKNITGAIDILKGDRPQGVTAASALEMLFEVGTGKINPALRRWKKFRESSQKKQLKLIAKKYREPRPEFINMLLSKNKDLAASQIKDFIGSDLHDNCNVVIEASSSIPRLLAAEKQKLIELANLNVLGLEDPQNRAEFLERQGIMGFQSKFGVDANRAEWENDLMDDFSSQNSDNQPVLLLADDDDVHIAIHEARQKHPSYLELSPEAQMMYQQHIEEHQNSKAQKEQQMMMQQMAMGMPPQGPQGPPQEPGTNKGPGIPKAAKAAQTMDLPGPHGGGEVA